MLEYGYYNMDCMDGLKMLPDKSIDLAIIDPPYGIAYWEWIKKKGLAHERETERIETFIRAAEQKLKESEADNEWVYIITVRSFLIGWAVNQCQLVKNVENRINGLNIGIKGHFGMDPETNGMVKAIC